MKIMVGLIALCLALVLTGCGAASSPSATDKPQVVATTTMIGDLVREIGGADVQLKVMIGPGLDPHTFKPSPADVADLKRADVVFYNGLHLEGTMVELLAGGNANRAAAVTRDMPHDRLLGTAGSHDPHVWFDPTLWEQAARTVAGVLGDAYPAQKAEFARRGDGVVEKLRKLHADNLATFASLPVEQRVLVTSHDAYNYFGRAYEVQVFGLQGISTETEAGLSNINNAVNFIMQHKVPAIFIESSVSPKTIERVRDDCRAKGWNVTIGGEIYSDALGSPGQHDGFAVDTYEGMMRYNVATIVKALTK
jgi:manganese/zinc/iron transport system substrate-binding protein